MNERARQLLNTADQQIAALAALLTTTDEAALRMACPGREKLGDGTVAEVARHTADTYLRIAGFIDGHGAPTPASTSHQGGKTRDAVDASRLMQRLAAGRHALRPLAEMTDAQLDAVPPADQGRFCDGQRTTEQVLAAMLKHQGHQVDALGAALA